MAALWIAGAAYLAATVVQTIVLAALSTDHDLPAAPGQIAPDKTLDEKTCPKCAEQIKAAAQVCRFCGHQFSPETFLAREAAVREAAQEKAAKAKAIRDQTLTYRLGKWIGRLGEKGRTLK